MLFEKCVGTYEDVASWFIRGAAFMQSDAQLNAKKTIQSGIRCNSLFPAVFDT
jgi:hypothetical protein